MRLLIYLDEDRAGFLLKNILQLRYQTSLDSSLISTTQLALTTGRTNMQENRQLKLGTSGCGHSSPIDIFHALPFKKKK